MTVQAQVSEGITTSVVESGAVFSAEAQATATATATLMIGQAVTGTFTPEGGQVLSFDERIRVLAPAGAVTQTTVVTMVSAPVRELGLPGQRGVHFSLSPDMHFAVSVTMIVSLTSCPESIYPEFIHQTDAERDLWELLPSDYDLDTQVLTALRGSFSDYGVDGVGGLTDTPLSHLLTNLPDVSAFSGAATYAYPIELPAGRNGLMPKVSLSYNSGGLNGLLGTVQSGPVGVGWSLGGSMQIVRRIESYYRDSTDQVMWGYRNRFTLVMNGASYKLVGPPEKLPNNGGCRYYAEDAPRLLVVRYTDDGDNDQLCGYGTQGAPTATGQESKEYWIVTGAGGTSYRFGYNADSEQITAMKSYGPDECDQLTQDCESVHPYKNFRGGYAGEAINKVASRWSVDRVRDLHGNTMTYTYFETPRTIPGQLTFDREQQLLRIRYTGN
ncbi:MAG: hypothetical protein GY720_05995, partial [bacterium]|nr:hypothetical protein [bacterium]